MALTGNCVDRHIGGWQERLSNSFRPYRKYWPSYLFHHAPLENALEIVRDGCIRSRNDTAGRRVRDVAGQGVIDNRDEAHGRVRLYFRPRTPTQFHIEGIRKPADCKFGTQAPILVFFVLNSRDILLDDEILLSDRNMQRNDRLIGDSDEFFERIPFDKVYHDGPIAADYSIIWHRCAEVLPAKPVLLRDSLKGIWFRSAPERDTFLHYLEEVAPIWNKFCNVSEDLKLFDKKFSFVDYVDISSEGFIFKINPRSDFGNISVRVLVKDMSGDVFIDFYNESMAACSPGGNKWIIRKPIPPGSYEVRMEIDYQLAYLSKIELTDVLF